MDIEVSVCLGIIIIFRQIIDHFLSSIKHFLDTIVFFRYEYWFVADDVMEVSAYIIILLLRINIKILKKLHFFYFLLFGFIFYRFVKAEF